MEKDIVMQGVVGTLFVLSILYPPANAIYTELTFVHESTIEDALYAVEKVNELRARYGKPPLRFDEDLYIIAKMRVDDMDKRDYFGHYYYNWTTYRGEGIEIYKPKYKAIWGKKFKTVGENIMLIAGSATGETNKEIVNELLQGWEESRGHRKNMLYEEYTAVAVYFREVKIDYFGKADMPCVIGVMVLGVDK